MPSGHKGSPAAPRDMNARKTPDALADQSATPLQRLATVASQTASYYFWFSVGPSEGEVLGSNAASTYCVSVGPNPLIYTTAGSLRVSAKSGAPAGSV